MDYKSLIEKLDSADVFCRDRAQAIPRLNQYDISTLENVANSCNEATTVIKQIAEKRDKMQSEIERLRTECFKTQTSLKKAEAEISRLNTELAISTVENARLHQENFWLTNGEIVWT